MKKKDLQSLFTQLTQGTEGDDADVPDTKIADALQKDAHPVFQIVYDRGHGAATTKSEDKVKSLDAQIATLSQEKTDALAKLEAERKKAPDTAEIRAQYEERERELQAEHKKREEALEAQLKDTRISTAMEKLTNQLTSAGNDGRRLDGDYASVLIQKDEVRNRIQVNDDGSVTVLQAGKQIALAPADGVSPLELLAKELKEQAPPKFVEVNGDRGAGDRGGTGGGGGGGFYSSYRKSLEEERKSNGGRPDATAEAKKRLGLTPAQ